MTHQIAFDWLTGEDEFLSEIARYGDAESEEFLSDGERKLALIVLRGLVAFVFVILASGSMPYSPRQLDRMKLDSELHAVLELDQAAWRARDLDRHNALIDPYVERGWVGQWRDSWGSRSATGHNYTLTLGPTQRISQDLVQAEVYVSLPRTNWWQPSISRETRFYRNTNGRWLRTLPPDNYWGDLTTLQTSSFTIHYSEADAASVRAAADRLDDAYVELYEILGLGEVPDEPRTVVILKPGLERARDWDRGDIEITSPILSQIPKGTSNADYLARRIFTRVASRTLQPRGASYRWAFMFTVIRGWLETEVLDQPSLWLEESDEVFRTHSAYMYPLRLSDIDEYYVGGLPGRDTVLWRYAAANTLIRYIVYEEGSEILPDVINGFLSYGSWAGLVEAVFDMTLEEFTAGWNEYLAEEYGFGTHGALERATR